MIRLKKTFRVDTMKTAITVVVCDSFKDAKKTKEGRLFIGDVAQHQDKLGSTFYSWNFKQNKGDILIVLLYKSLTLDIIGHECFHAVHRLLGFCCTDLTNDTKELFATKNGYLSELVLRAIYKKPQLRRRLFQ